MGGRLWYFGVHVGVPYVGKLPNALDQEDKKEEENQVRPFRLKELGLGLGILGFGV